MEVQIGLVLPILILIYRCNSAFGFVLTILGIIAGLIITGFTYYVNDIKPSFQSVTDEKFYKISLLPQTHVDSLCFGVLLGFAY